MSTKLTQKVIGSRIAELRKKKGLSQDDLAKRIKMSRPSLAQIELGNRCVDIMELHSLSIVLEFSLDYFMSKDFNTKEEIESKPEPKSKKMEERISVPTLNLKKFKNEIFKTTWI